jgi:hypothetical protein
MATVRDETELRELGHELVEDHRAVEELADILSVTGRDRTNYSKRIKSAVLDSLLIRCRSLLDFYWQDLLQPTLFNRRSPEDAFAHDFFIGDDRARARWESGRALAVQLVRPWLTGRRRINQEFAHLSHRRGRPPALPRGERWWMPEHPWGLVVVSGRAFEEALAPNAYGDLAGRLHDLWRPFFAEHSIAEIVAHVQMFVDDGVFTADLAGPRATARKGRREDA